MFFEVQDLTKTYTHNGHHFAAVDHLSFSLAPGEILAVAGESGSGKSTLCRIICQFSRADSGHILFHDQDITNVPEKERKQLYRHIQMVFQHPYRSFHPRFTLEKSILAGIRNYHLPVTPEMFQQYMEEVHLTRDIIRRYPHEVSGGECQRAALLRSLVIGPELLICDEVTSALDATIRNEIAGLIRRICQHHRIACLFITHDLYLARTMADRILIMHHGQTVEEGPAEQLFHHPQQTYTQELLSSLL